MLGGMVTTYKEAKAAVARLRSDVAPEFQPEIAKLADLFDDLLDGAAKGGRARAQKLTKKRRKEIAVKAANARWDKARENALAPRPNARGPRGPRGPRKPKGFQGRQPGDKPSSLAIAHD